MSLPPTLFLRLTPGQCPSSSSVIGESARQSPASPEPSQSWPVGAYLFDRETEERGPANFFVTQASIPPDVVGPADPQVGSCSADSSLTADGADGLPLSTYCITVEVSDCQSICVGGPCCNLHSSAALMTASSTFRIPLS